MIALDIYSDPICPWCYIGKVYLERALEGLNENPFNIEWHPFQLNPEMPPTGICLLYTSPSPRDGLLSRMPSSA